jgi:hypothetical protein
MIGSEPIKHVFSEKYALEERDGIMALDNIAKVFLSAFAATRHVGLLIRICSLQSRRADQIQPYSKCSNAVVVHSGLSSTSRSIAHACLTVAILRAPFAPLSQVIA